MKNPKHMTAAVFLILLGGCLLLVLSGIIRTLLGLSPPVNITRYQPGSEGVSYLELTDWFKDTCQAVCTSELPGQVKLMEVNAAVNRIAGKWIFESTEVIRLNNGHFASAGFMYYYQDPPDERVIHFRDFAEQELNVPYLYIEAPCKLCKEDSQLPMENMTNVNGETDSLLERLRDAGIDTMDLRQNLHADGFDHYDSFFLTDHHWTVPVGLWAARTIVEELNGQYNLQMDSSALTEEKFENRIWKNVFVGSWGRKVTTVFAPPEDFVLPVPIEPVHMRLTRFDGTHEGGFEALYDESQIVPDNYYTGNSYGSLLYGDCGYIKIENLDNPNGPVIAVLRESFAGAVGPYLSLAAGELHLVDARYYTGSVKELLAEIKPDAVVSLLNVQCYVNAYFDMVQ